MDSHPALAAPAAVDRSPAPEQKLLQQMGGVAGIIQSSVPVFVFVPVNTVAGLRWAGVAAFAVAIGILGWRLYQRTPVQPAISGFFGVVICLGIAWYTGEARGFFLYGIWVSLVYGAAFIFSVVVRRPLVGLLWTFVNGGGNAWRTVVGARRAYAIATLAWAVVFGARFVVQRWLYDADQTGWLAVARIGMGWPLAGIAFAVTVAMVRRADREVATARVGHSAADGVGGAPAEVAGG